MSHVRTNTIDGGLYAVVMPSLAAVVLGDMEEVVLLIETAIWSREKLPVVPVTGWRDDVPMNGTEELDMSPGSIVIYGRTPSDARYAAYDHAQNMTDALGHEDIYADAMSDLGEQLGFSWPATSRAIADYVSALASHPYFS